MRKCTKCGIKKILSEFPVRKDSKRRYWQCRECNTKIATEWNRNNALLRLATSARQRAKKDGLVCTIDKKWILQNATASCPCCRMPFRSGPSTGRGKVAEDRPSLDRVDPDLGYTPENTRIICTRCNRIKDEGSAEDHIRIAEWLLAGAPQRPCEEIS